MMMRSTKSLALVALTMGAAALGPARSEAGFIISVQQVGSAVVVTGSGSANLAALTIALSGQSYNAVVFPSGPGLLVGAPASQSSDDYEFISGPGVFGNGGFAKANSGSGQHFGLNAFSPTQLLLDVPHNYVSGTMLSSSSTYAGSTFTSLGLTSGTYVYTWGSGATADSMTIQVGPSAVPEPSSLAMCGIAGLVGLVVARVRRKPAVA